MMNVGCKRREREISKLYKQEWSQLNDVHCQTKEAFSGLEEGETAPRIIIGIIYGRVMTFLFEWILMDGESKWNWLKRTSM